MDHHKTRPKHLGSPFPGLAPRRLGARQHSRNHVSRDKCRFRHRPTHAFNSTVHLSLDVMCVGEKLQAMPEYARQGRAGRSEFQRVRGVVRSTINPLPGGHVGDGCGVRDASREGVGTQLRTPAIAHQEGGPYHGRLSKQVVAGRLGCRAMVAGIAGDG